MEYFSTTWMWLGFSLVLVTALIIDTLVIAKYRARSSETWRASLLWSLFWVVVSLSFNLGLWIYLLSVTDPATAHLVSLNFLTAYIVEQSLSIDNLFVFYLVFKYFNISISHQHRVLTYGIWGAVFMRLGVILAGIWLVTKFHWLLYVMGAFLIFTGIKIMWGEEEENDLSESFVLKCANKLFRVTQKLSDDRFFVRINKVLYATPLFIALICIEFSDLIFAVDSIPAVFAITRNSFIVWSSNIFAILGLRAMYFVLAKMVEDLHLLKYGIALILIYVGCKMLVEPWFKISPGISLGVILGAIIIFSFISIYSTRRHAKK